MSVLLDETVAKNAFVQSQTTPEEQIKVTLDISEPKAKISQLQYFNILKGSDSLPGDFRRNLARLLLRIRLPR